MEINGNKINIDDVLSDMKLDFHKNVGNLILTDKQSIILRQYGFDLEKYNNIKELMFDLEDYLNDEGIDELDEVLKEISEFNYYHNTNK